jgi:hypothetical protein
VIVRGAPADAVLTIDDVARPAPPGHPVPLPAGPHRIVVRTPKTSVTRTFTVLPDTATELVLRAEPSNVEAARSAVLAPADDYVGSDAYTIEGAKIVVRASGHVVVARFGESSVRFDGVTTAYDVAPTTIGGKLYLPLALLEKLSDDMSKSP